jgi:large subunit ribosomal protein L35
MPKMKTKSGAKKRFKRTASGLLTFGRAGKKHGMIKRPRKFIRNTRTVGILNSADTKAIKGFMPYDR